MYKVTHATVPHVPERHPRSAGQMWEVQGK